MKFIFGGVGGGAAHCFPSQSLHCYKGNIPQFDNYWGAPAKNPQPPPAPLVPTCLFSYGYLLILTPILFCIWFFSDCLILHKDIQVRKLALLEPFQKALCLALSYSSSLNYTLVTLATQVH